MSSGSKTLKMYALTGIVKAIHAPTHKVTLHSTHIRGRKEPSERDYTVKQAVLLSRIREGDFVHATLLTDHADVWLLDEPKFVHKSRPQERKTPSAGQLRAVAGDRTPPKKIAWHDSSGYAAHRSHRSGAAR